MKKLIFLIVLILFLAACAPASQPTFSADDTTENIHDISERFFITETEHIYLNRDDYMGQLIRYEGIFRTVFWDPPGQYFPFVIRLMDDCCGPGGMVGFELRFPDHIRPPEEEAWVELIGRLERFDEDGEDFVRLYVVAITVLEERGLEIVVR